MKTIDDLIDQIKDLEKILSSEIQKKEEAFFYKIYGKQVKFLESTKQYHKSLASRIHIYLLNIPILNILVVPLAWFGLVPAVFMDLVVSTYQLVCFPLYKIPKVRRNEYIVIDRHALQYLNAIEKLSCVYCGYFNGLIAYVQEVAARSEQYFCPIKHARKIGHIHSRYKYFLEYGDGANYKDKSDKIARDFKELE